MILRMIFLAGVSRTIFVVVARGTGVGAGREAAGACSGRTVGVCAMRRFGTVRAEVADDDGIGDGDDDDDDDNDGVGVGDGGGVGGSFHCKCFSQMLVNRSLFF